MNNKLVESRVWLRGWNESGLPGYESTYIGNPPRPRSWSPPPRSASHVHPPSRYIYVRDTSRNVSVCVCMCVRVSTSVCGSTSSYRLTLSIPTTIQYGPPPAGVKSTSQQAKRRSITEDLHELCSAECLPRNTALVYLYTRSRKKARI